jgi:hypothetical protein
MIAAVGTGSSRRKQPIKWLWQLQQYATESGQQQQQQMEPAVWARAAAASVVVCRGQSWRWLELVWSGTPYPSAGVVQNSCELH